MLRLEHEMFSLQHQYAIQYAIKYEVLAESLRRMTSSDTAPKFSPVASLDFKVDTGFGDTAFSDFVDVGKKVLLFSP